MSLITKFNGGVTPFRSMLSDLFDTENALFGRLALDENRLPAVNISENDKTFEIELAVPGMQKGDFKVKVEDDMLSISAEHKEEKETKKKNYLRQEYRSSAFVRTFTLPENAKGDDIKAHYEDGILKLSVAKKSVSVSKAKEIAVV